MISNNGHLQQQIQGEMSDTPVLNKMMISPQLDEVAARLRLLSALFSHGFSLQLAHQHEPNEVASPITTNLVCTIRNTALYITRRFSTYNACTNLLLDLGFHNF